jgi:amino acid adenylation domain-containing protein
VVATVASGALIVRSAIPDAPRRLEGDGLVAEESFTGRRIAALTPKQKLLIGELLRRRGLQLNPATPIEPADRGALLPCSSGQRSMWLLDRLNPGSPVYNISFVLWIEGEVDLGAMSRALTSIVARHEVLRTAILEQDGEPRQKILPAMPFSIVRRDCPAGQASVREWTRGEIEREIRTPFDLTLGRPIRVTGFQLGRSECALAVVVHHIAADGWSLTLLARELVHFYRRELGAIDDPLPHLTVQYADFACWQRRNAAQEHEKQLAYWRESLRNMPEPLLLPYDRARTAEAGARGGIETLKLGVDEAGALRRAAQALGGTLYAVLLAGLFLVLSRACDQHDILIGSAQAGRMRTEFEPLIGLFANTFPIRFKVDLDGSVQQFLADLKRAVTNAQSHSDLPFDTLVENLAPDRASGRNPLFQVMFVLQNMPQPTLDLPDLRIRIEEKPTTTAKFDLLFIAMERGGELELALEYDAALFTIDTARHLLRRFANALTFIAQQPKSPVDALEWCSPEERQAVTRRSNGETRPLPYATVLTPIHRCMAAQPHAAALHDGSVALTYAQLGSIVRTWRARLRAEGLRPGGRVGMLFQGGLNHFVGVIAILDAGGTCVPLDSRWPESLFSQVIANGQLDLVVTDSTALDRLALVSGEKLLIMDTAIPSQADVEIESCDSGWEPKDDLSRDVAYILHTSGSTGRPKAVMFPHLALANLIAWHSHCRPGAYRTAQLAPWCFDVSFYEALTAWSAGGSLVLHRRREFLDLDELTRFLAVERIERLFLLPEVLLALCEHADPGEHRFPDLREVVSTGGRLHVTPAIRRFFSRHREARLINDYGPTETHVVTSFALEGDPASWHEMPPIGIPICNVAALVLDNRGQPLPSGHVGELCISGPCVSYGYLNQPDQTARAFLPNTAGLAGTRMYRTGDLARWNADCNLEYVGRRDRQIKVQGYRVALEEVEAALLSHPLVRAAVAFLYKINDRDSILAAAIEPALSAQEVRDMNDALGRRLQKHMIPARYFTADHLQRNANGKIDARTFSPAACHEHMSQADEQAQPSGDGARLLAIWREMLGRTDIARTHNFFELGGHSLLAARLVFRIQQEFGRRIPLSRFFDSPTIEGVMDYFGRTDRSDDGLIDLESGPATSVFAASAAQCNLFRVLQALPLVGFYNLPAVLRLNVDLDTTAFMRALDEVLARHGILRGSFHLDDRTGELQVRIASSGSIRVPLVEIASDETLSNEHLTHRAYEEAITPFDLTTAPLLRCTILRDPTRAVYLLITTHHLVSDGWSLRLLAREVCERYRAHLSGFPPRPTAPGLQFSDYCRWQARWIRSKEGQVQQSYWLDQLSESEPFVLPTSFPRPARTSFDVRHTAAAIGRPLLEAMKETAALTATTPFMLFVAGLCATLFGRYGSPNLHVGVIYANRNLPATQSIVGLLANTLILRARPTGSQAFREFLDSIRRVTIGAFSHAEFPIELLAEELSRQGLPRNCHCPVLINWLDEHESDASEDPLFSMTAVHPMEAYGISATSADLIFALGPSASGMEARITYKSLLFTDAWVQDLFAQTCSLLELALRDSQQSLADLARRLN